MLRRIRACNRWLQALLLHDFFPTSPFTLGLRRLRDLLKTPIACLSIAGIVASVCAIYINPLAWPIVLSIAGLALIGTIWPILSVRGVRCELVFSEPRGRVGETSIAKVQMRNLLPWPVWGLAIDIPAAEVGSRGPSVSPGIANTLSGETPGPRIAIAQLNAWSEIEFTWETTPLLRGRYPISPPLVSTGFPFGILWGKRKVDVREQQIVWPQSVPLDSFPHSECINVLDLSYSDRIVGDCGDVLGTREFRHGDSLRKIHWGQTARHQRVIVTERQAQANVTVSLMVDVDHRSHSDRHSPGSLEQIIRIAASICESMPRLSIQVECEIGKELFHLGRRDTDLLRVLDYLADIPHSGIVDPNQGCRFHGPRAASTIILTTASSFLEHLGHRHTASSNQRFVLVDSSSPANSPENITEHSAGCGCHAWIQISAEEDLAETFPEIWSRACHE